MKNKPERLTISEQREQEIKNKYKYSNVYVYSPSFLQEYKEAILAYFSEPEKKEEIHENMEKITEFVIGDRISHGLSRLCCSQQVIHMDEQYADITEDSFTIREGHEYIETIFIHELLHAASRQKGNNRNLTGILDFIRDENGNVVKGPNNRKYIGLNEGITQYLAEKISQKPVPNDIDSYTFNKSVVYLLSDILGEEVLKSSYFDHTPMLKDVMNGLAQDENYFEEFNRQLDTINKLETTIRRIENGKINPENKEECLARMRAVSKAQQAALMEGLFSKVIIPQVEKIEIPEVTDSLNPEQVAARNDALTKRQALLLPILRDHPELLRSVAKYIPDHSVSEFVSDEFLTDIKKEISTNGMSFEKIAQAAKSTNENFIIGPRITADFLKTVDEFYEQNPDALKDRSTTLTPLLKRQLVKMVEVLDQLEAMAEKIPTPETEASVRNFRDVFLKKHFHMITNLEEEIEKIREERKKGPTTNSSEVEPPSFDPLAEARKKGQQTAADSVHENPPEGEKVEKEESEEKKDGRKPTLTDKFIIDNQTSAIIDQRNISIYNRAVNISAATGELVTIEDENIVAMRNRAVQQYIASLPNRPPAGMEKVYGDKWREALVSAFEEGYNIGMQMQLRNAQAEGLEKRETTKKQLEENKYTSSAKQPDLEEMRFISENFVVQEVDGNTVVVDKETNQPVLDERTTKSALFVDEWIRVTGDEAFTQESAEVYRFIQHEMMIEGKAEEEIMADAEAMGSRYKDTLSALLENEEAKKKMEEFFAVPKEEKKETEASEPKKEPNPKYADMGLEEVTELLNRYNSPPEPEKKAIVDPVIGFEINERYRELKGEDHPVFVQEAPAIIASFQAQKEEMIQAGLYKPEYFERLEGVKKELEARHPELVSEDKSKGSTK